MSNLVCLKGLYDLNIHIRIRSLAIELKYPCFISSLEILKKLTTCRFFIKPKHKNQLYLVPNLIMRKVYAYGL